VERSERARPRRAWRALSTVVELGAGIALVVLAVRWSGGEQVGPGRVALAFLGTAVAMVVLHEGAHAVVGRLLGYRVFRVVVGSGPRWLRFGLGHAQVEVRGLPVSGFTQMASTEPDDLGLRYRLSVLAGPVVPLLVVAVVLLSWPGAGPDPVWAAMAVVLAAAGAVTSLIPRESDGLASDGLLLVRAWHRHGPLLEAGRHGHDLLALDRAVEAGDAAEVERIAGGPAPFAAAMAAAELRRWDDAIDASRAALAEDPSADLRRLLGNVLAFALAHRAGPGDLDEADRISSELYTGDPGQPGLADTRGLVLLRLGRAAEAVDPLERSATDRALPERARAEVLARLAVARYGAGDPHGGRRDLARAIGVDATDPDVAAAVRAVAAAEAGFVRGFWDLVEGDEPTRAGELRRALGPAAPATLAVLSHLSPEHPDLARIGAALARSRRARRGSNPVGERPRRARGTPGLQR
jgi:tetratricopeptide (TPR) repeat protein